MVDVKNPARNSFREEYAAYKGRFFVYATIGAGVPSIRIR
jgi:hypothetical protein